VSPRRRRFSPLPLVGLSLALMLAPSALSHKVRLTALGVFTPLRRLAAAVSDVFPRPAPAGERDIALRENAFLRDRVETLASENARLRDRLAQAAGSPKRAIRRQSRTAIRASTPASAPASAASASGTASAPSAAPASVSADPSATR